MGERYIDELRGLPADELAPYLTARSGLPGPRGNLALADAFAAIADRATILLFVALDDEYLRFCGTEAIGRLIAEDLDDASLTELLRQRAGDDLWRVREGASRALQILGDVDHSRLRTIVAEWAADSNPYVRRAAVAAICEPRLLTDPPTRMAALQACHRTSESITKLPATERKTPGVRNLRQALGYCWSVAVAADLSAGMSDFERLRTVDDPDIKWIVASNLKKSRLRRHLEQ
ncbi:MAG: HEAT repeat domain-containing protein [Actinomycetes bacterium]